MKMTNWTVMAVMMVVSAVANAGISQRDAQAAKERIARCQYNDAACVGNALLDAMSSDRPAPFPGNGNSNNGSTGAQNLVMVYSNSDSCNGNVAATLVLGADLQRNLQSCDSQSASTGAWSISINGRCTDISDTNVKSACLQAVSILNANGGR